MKPKEMIKLINEEITGFDFLNNEAYIKEKENLSLIQNEDFQKQFLIDSVLKRDKIKINVTDARISGDWENTDDGEFNIEYYVGVEYWYDPNKEQSKFMLNFDGTSIRFTKETDIDKGDFQTAPYSESEFSDINWLDISVGLSTFDGDEIKFGAFVKAPDKIKTIFIKEYLKGFIENETEQEVV